MEKREPDVESRVSDETPRFETILYDVDADDRVATITLNRPEVLNAFDRQMCEEIARRRGTSSRPTTACNAVVLRAAGDRAFSAGLDTSKSFGQPDLVWNHDDPGELLSPKWQKCWKPVVCAVHGMCTAGALYFVNEADVVDLLRRRHLLRLPRHLRLRVRARAHRLMRRIGLGDTLRMALMGNRERVSAETALRLGLVTEVVARDELWDRAHEIAAHHRLVPGGRHPGHGARDLGVARQAVPRRDGPGPHVHAPRQPGGAGRDRSAPASTTTPPGSGERRRMPMKPASRSGSRAGHGARPVGARARVRAARGPPGASWPPRPTLSTRRCADAVSARARRWACMLRNRPVAVGTLLGRAARRRVRGHA